MKRDFISLMLKPNGFIAVKKSCCNPRTFIIMNSHPHCVLGYRSLLEYLLCRAYNKISNRKCLEISGQIRIF